jgi:hypothetical protein
VSDTSTNGSARNGTAISNVLAEPGTVSVLCVGSITTSSVVATYKVQVSVDGTTYYDPRRSTTPRRVTTAAGTGSAVAHSFVLDAEVRGVVPLPARGREPSGRVDQHRGRDGSQPSATSRRRHLHLIGAHRGDADR